MNPIEYALMFMIGVSIGLPIGYTIGFVKTGRKE